MPSYHDLKIPGVKGQTNLNPQGHIYKEKGGKSNSLHISVRTEWLELSAVNVVEVI